MRITHRFICIILAAALPVSLLWGCKQGQSGKPPSTASSAPAVKNAPVISEAMLNSIVKTGKVDIGSVGPGGFIYAPKSSAAAKSVLKRVAAWLKQAKPYTGSIPKSQISEYAIKANVEPPRIDIIAADKLIVSVQPVFYILRNGQNGFNEQSVPDVLKLYINKKITYIKSKPLFDYINMDKWQSDFKMM